MGKTRLSASISRKSIKSKMKKMNLRRWKNVLDPATTSLDSVGKRNNITNDVKNTTNNTLQHETIESILNKTSVSIENREEEESSDSGDEDTQESETHDYEVEYETNTIPLKKNSCISGRRVINISHFLEQLQNMSHQGFGCSFWNMSVISEKILGLESIFTFKCNMCGICETARTDNIRVESTSGTNLSAVLGSVAAGIGYSQLNELISAMNMPNMSNKTYTYCHSVLSASIETENEVEIKKAGEQERQLAVDAGEVNKNGVPIISVIVDGAWSKRSYRTNYNALSGVGCIIGARTKKILYVSVKNKYCFVCARANLLEPPEHACFKNWTGSSTAMESAIIVEGFRKSMQMHGLIYGKVIGDGDSSVYRKLVESSPYGPTFVIEKIECRNHLLRNYINKLSDLSKDTSVPIDLRRKVISNDSLRRFRHAVTKAISFRKQENLSLTQKQLRLEKDIVNGPRHILGEHTYCDKYFCKEQVSNAEKNQFSKVQSSGLYVSIMKANKRLAENVSSLLHDVDTNAAETFNSVVAKFVGGKRINFALKGGYECRCKAAAISYNTKGDFIWSMQKKLFGDDIRLTHFERFRELKRKASESKSKGETPKRKSHALTDHDYGPEAAGIDITPDMDLELYSNRAKEFMDELSNVDLKQISQETILQSKSEKWKIERKKRITASTFGKICKLRKSTNTAKTVADLLYSNFKGTEATEFGLTSEINAISLFEEAYNMKHVLLMV